MKSRLIIKRLFDFTFSLFGIILFIPVFFIVGILIKLDSKGPIIYKAKRIGLHEKEFIFYKFRTMRPNSDNYSITIGDKDDRITNFGYFLRKTKLDEIPQLINVLIGDLSFVGPRPDLYKYKEFYKKYFSDYFKFKPGITSYSSIFFRNESELYIDEDDPELVYINKTIPKKVELDKKYFSSISLSKDINLILKTLKKVLE